MGMDEHVRSTLESIGERKDVFGGLPYCLYLPSGNAVAIKAETVCEIAECRVPSKAKLEPKLITLKESLLQCSHQTTSAIFDSIF
jgi:5-deoxy-D-glucuronate isomerase